ncbi:hypothetical protein B0H63DRAFT_524754 [Podospora didyma]|uniref:Alpha/beta hydrolase fold-3 domain-containing protein n=1 Tax=Podospora didyma TaxID=330526 RepID=A0AAE0KJQ1_9PEZI|nr:hypothetical protein B0H63DRAFT_524754 [Podospora didyma]
MNSASSNTNSSRTAHQPIHPDIRPLLDPEYVAFHDQYLQYVLPDDRRPWDGSARRGNPGVPCAESTLVTVGSVRDLRVKDRSDLRFNGGGWAVGDGSHNNDLCALICQRAQCLVVTVGCRLAPELPYLAALEDAADAL